jgi:hypothetical protein
MRQDATRRDKGWEGCRRLRAMGNIYGKRTKAGRQGGGREHGVKKKGQKQKGADVFCWLKRNKGTTQKARVRQVENSGKAKKDARMSSLSLVNKKGRRKKDDNNKRPKRRFKNMDIHIPRRCDVMVSSAPSPSSCQCLLSVLLPYADDETGIDPDDAVDTPFKREHQNSVKDVR